MFWKNRAKLLTFSSMKRKGGVVRNVPTICTILMLAVSYGEIQSLKLIQLTLALPAYVASMTSGLCIYVLAIVIVLVPTSKLYSKCHENNSGDLSMHIV